MAKVNFVKKARKDIPQAGIKAGDSYYWWKLRIGVPKQYSKEQPKRSRLTASSFYATLWDIEDDAIGGLAAEDTLKEARDDIVQQLEDLKQECEDNLENMPEGLREGSIGQMLQERVEGLESAIDELNNVDFDDKEEDETDEEFWQRKLEDVQQVSIEVP
jgi:hypothetical protein